MTTTCSLFRFKHSFLILVSIVVTPLALGQLVRAQPAEPTPYPTLSATYGKLGLTFEANAGQSDGRVKYLARGPGYTLFLTPDEAVMTLRVSKKKAAPPATSVVRMRLVGANRDVQVTGLDPQIGKSNYFIGNDPARWHHDIPNYSRVHYSGVYPGIDLVYLGNQRQLEYDFLVAPGADPRRIELAFRGIDALSIDGNGNLVLATGHGEIVQQKPVVYQEIDGQRKVVEGRYVLRGKHRARFAIAKYDTTRALVIDPVLVYSTFLGGSWIDDGYAIALDGSRNMYVAGETGSTNFPACTASGCPPPIQPGSGGADVFVAKLNAAGTELVYSTYLVGSLGETARGLAVDASGNAYITGYTFSNNFPQVGAVQGPNVAGGQSDAFVSKINATGSALVYSTYLGGAGIFGFGNDIGNAIAVDGNGNAYVTGVTSSNTSCASQIPCDAGHGLVGCLIGNQCQSLGFPTTAGAFQGNSGSNEYTDAFVTKLNAAGNTLLYSTYLGGSSSDAGNGIAITSAGDVYIGGITYSPNFPGASSSPIQPTLFGASDAFVFKFNPAGTAVVFSTYLGGNGFDQALAIALDGAANAYVTGSTNSTNFPGASSSTIQSAYAGGFEDAFVAKVSSDGTTLSYSTYLGGSAGGDTINYDDQGHGIAVDANGAAYVVGETQSTDFPIVAAIQNNNAGITDAWVTKVNPAGSALIYSTYLGGPGYENGRGITLDSSGNAYIVGTTQGAFPTVAPFQADGAGQSDAFVAKIAPTTATTTTLGSSLNPSALGDSVTFTATVTGAGATGTVQFKNGAANLGAPVALSGGMAQSTHFDLAVGTHSITAVYGGDSSFNTSTSAPLSQEVLPPFGAPSGLIATALGIVPQVFLTWNLVGHADHYEVARRSSITNGFVTIATTPGRNYLDFGIVANTTYLYVVRAVNSSGAPSADSSMDPATTVAFTDDPLVAGFTTVGVAHLNQLRTAVNAMRMSANLVATTFTDPTVGTTTLIKAVHVQQLRTALLEARSALGLTSASYTDTLTATVTPIKAIHFQELRDRTK